MIAKNREQERDEVETQEVKIVKSRKIAFHSDMVIQLFF